MKKVIIALILTGLAMTAAYAVNTQSPTKSAEALAEKAQPAKESTKEQQNNNHKVPSSEKDTSDETNNFED